MHTELAEAPSSLHKVTRANPRQPGSRSKQRIVMAKKASTAKKKPDMSCSSNEYDDTPAVAALIAEITHPMKVVIEAIRETILCSDSAITEGVKWNSPSFYCNGWFATVGVRKPDRLEVVLHHGAKVRRETTLQTTIRDSGKLLKWASPDRAIITIAPDVAFETIQPELQSIVKQWAAYQKKLDPPK